MEKPVRDNNLAQQLTPNSESDRPVLTSIDGGQAKGIDPLDEISFRKTKRQHIREFGSIIALALVFIAGAKLYKGGNINTIIDLCGSSALFFALCLKTPRLMLPVFKGWMKMAGVLEVVMTWFILGTLWFVTFFPLGLVFRIIGKSTMTLGFEPSRVSYWEDCAHGRNDFGLLERQY